MISKERRGHISIKPRRCFSQGSGEGMKSLPVFMDSTQIRQWTNLWKGRQSRLKACFHYSQNTSRGPLPSVTCKKVEFQDIHTALATMQAPESWDQETVAGTWTLKCRFLPLLPPQFPLNILEPGYGTLASHGFACWSKELKATSISTSLPHFTFHRNASKWQDLICTQNPSCMPSGKCSFIFSASLV